MQVIDAHSTSGEEDIDGHSTSGEQESLTSTTGELTLKQSLLILCSLTAVSSVHYKIGDPRSLEDFLEREEDAWLPKVGTEDYKGLQDERTEQMISWNGCASAFDLAFPDGPFDIEELRSQLRHNLEEMSQLQHNFEEMSQLQVADDCPPPVTATTLDQSTSRPFHWKMSLWLVLFSCAVIPSGQLSSTFWDTERLDLQQLAKFLSTSPLFRDPLTATKLEDWIGKLKFLFCGAL